MQPKQGKLSLVATPIGNLGDITYRAVETLKSVDYILAEDTRQSNKLLQHYQIKKKLVAYHTHNEHHITAKVISDLQHQHIALISDAGTPAISDPGYLLIRECIQAAIPFEVIPGASAFIVGILLSGFPTQPFSFIGFLPQKKGRRKALEQLKNQSTVVLYESPHRIIKLLEELIITLEKDTQIAVAKELTKINEAVYRGTPTEVLSSIATSTIKGEFVVIIDNKN